MKYLVKKKWGKAIDTNENDILNYYKQALDIDWLNIILLLTYGKAYQYIDLLVL